MKTQAPRQLLASAIRRLKPHTQVADYGRDPKKELAEVKQHIKARFEESVSYKICHQGISRLQAEKEALEHALFRCESWEKCY